MYALALAASLANALPIAVKLVLLTGIGINLRFIIKQVKDKHYLIKQSEGLGWELTDGDDFKPIQILNSTVITRFAIFLHFIDQAKKQSLLIVNDALSDDDYRRLIVRLKTAGKQ